MSYIESNLVPGETVIYQTRLHWIVMLWHVMLGCILFGLPGILLLYYALTQPGIEITSAHVMEGGVLRYSGTEPKVRLLLEGRDAAVLNQWSQSISRALKKELG